MSRDAYAGFHPGGAGWVVGRFSGPACFDKKVGAFLSVISGLAAKASAIATRKSAMRRPICGGEMSPAASPVRSTPIALVERAASPYLSPHAANLVSSDGVPHRGHDDLLRRHRALNWLTTVLILLGAFQAIVSLDA